MDWDEPTAQLAKTLFGRSLRVLLAAWIIDRQGSAFFLQEAQDAMRPYEEAPSGVTQELRKFVRLGMLVESPALRRVYFTPTENPMWAAFDAIITAIQENQASAPLDSARRR